MKSFKFKIKKLWWIEGLIALLAALTFVACGKSGGGGVLASNPGQAGIANGCTAYGCFGAQTGQQIARVQGRLSHDDELDNSTESAQNRLMEIGLSINTMSNMNSMTSMMNLNLMNYNGPVLVSGQIQVVAPIIGCNIPQGSYQVQSQGPSMLVGGTISGLLGVNVNGGQGFTINLRSVNVVPSNFVQGGFTQGLNEARLVGFLSVPNCENASFKVE